jgi:hypothetical protein
VLKQRRANFKMSEGIMASGVTNIYADLKFNRDGIPSLMSRVLWRIGEGLFACRRTGVCPSSEEFLKGHRDYSLSRLAT